VLKTRLEHGSDVVTLRSASPKDEPFLARLYATTREEDLRLMDWDDEQKAAFCAWQFRLQQLDYSANYGDAGHWVISRDAVPIGRIWIVERDDCIFVVDISLLPEYCAGGVGTLVLQAVFAEGDRMGLPVRLTAFRNNLRAIALFERLGFRVQEENDVLFFLERPPRA
jgi:RimJ/RimL family protein N-acetyltransferase